MLQFVTVCEKENTVSILDVVCVFKQIRPQYRVSLAVGAARSSASLAADAPGEDVGQFIAVRDDLIYVPKIVALRNNLHAAAAPV
jgi:hypothetical protein